MGDLPEVTGTETIQSQLFVDSFVKNLWIPARRNAFGFKLAAHPLPRVVLTVAVTVVLTVVLTVAVTVTLT